MTPQNNIVPETKFHCCACKDESFSHTAVRDLGAADASMEGGGRTTQETKSSGEGIVGGCGSGAMVLATLSGNKVARP